MKGKLTIKSTWELLKESGKGFSDDKVTKLSGALAYFTVFSFGPLLIIVIFLSGLFFGQEAAQGKIYETLEGFLGADTASQLQKVIVNAAISGKSTIAAVIGFVTLLIGATTVFAEIQDSINSIWGLKPKPKKGWLKLLKNRVLSFSVIVSLGFILVVSLAVTTIIDAFSKRLQQLFPDMAVVVFYIVNQLLTLCITTLIFGVVFKVLPDAKIKWKDVMAGALVTALLFMIGKFAISFYISTTSVGSTYGAAGSLVVLLLWTYYSSIILYFGAEFTKAWSKKFGSPIHPAEYAVTTKQVEVQTGKETVQEKEGR
jgi:membrane protein